MPLMASGEQDENRRPAVRRSPRGASRTAALIGSPTHLIIVDACGGVLALASPLVEDMLVATLDTGRDQRRA